LKYHPSYLAEHLVDEAELDDVLEEWLEMMNKKLI